MKKFYYLGYSLIEMLIVMSVFAILGVLVTQVLAISMKSSRKAQSLNKIRTELTYAMNVMERNIRNAKSITSCNSPLQKSIYYIDQKGDLGSFRYYSSLGPPPVSLIASGSAEYKLTSSDIWIDESKTSFSCDLYSSPQFVTINISAYDPKLSGGESTQVEMKTQITLRNIEE